MPLGVELSDWLWMIDATDEKPEGAWGLWTDHGEAATAFFASKHPGYRPTAWWRHEGFGDCAGPPKGAFHLPEQEPELDWLERNGCLFPGEREAALASKAKRPACAQAFHEAHWRYVREAHAKGKTAVV